MKQKTKKILFNVVMAVMLAAFAAFFLYFVFKCSPQIADACYAEEEAPAVDEAQAEEQAPLVVIQEKEETVADVFKNNILPYIVSAGSAVAAVGLTLLPSLKLRGKYKSLQGVCTAMNKTIELYKDKDGKLEEVFAELIDSTTKKLTAYIDESLDKALAKVENESNTNEISSLKVSVDTISAQFSNILKAATVAWGELPGVKELLAKSPNAEVLEKYYALYMDLKAKYDAAQSAEVKELDEAIKDLGAYDNANE